MVYVDKDRCKGCGLCVQACPTGAIQLIDGVARVEQSLCRECHACLSACPMGAMLMVQEPISADAPEPAAIPTRRLAPSVSPGGIQTWLGNASAFLQREVAPRIAAFWENRDPSGPYPYRSVGFYRDRPYAGRGGGRRARRRRGRW
ncbi:MAG: 4Fe-4S binding protein [Anaerolineales bacterium]|nr:4Fe-4S binding protein [Anaerolineales bacterium]